MKTAFFAWANVFEKYGEVPAPAQHLGFLLAIKSDPDLTIPARFTPSIARIAKWSRQSEASVKRNLNTLEASGWLVRRRPTIEAARREHARTQYALTIPAGVPVDNFLAGVQERGENAEGMAQGEPCRGSQRAKGMAHSEPLPSLSTISSSITFAEADASGTPDGVRSRSVPVEDEAKTAAALEWLEVQFDGFEGIEESTARGMLDGGSNRVAVLRTLRKMRGTV